MSISFEKGEGLLFNEPGINSWRARYNVTCVLKAHLDHTNIWFLVGITTLAMDSFSDSLTMSPFTVLRRGGGEGCSTHGFIQRPNVLKLKPGHVLKTVQCVPFRNASPRGPVMRHFRYTGTKCKCGLNHFNHCVIVLAEWF